jgi:GTPase
LKEYVPQIKNKVQTALLVQVYFKDRSSSHLSEFQDLVCSANIQALGDVVTTTRLRPDMKYFVGKGKAFEIQALVKETQAELVIFNHNLSPIQVRNLEKLCDCTVLDRITLILDIFSRRARTFEGKLQVELAQLKYLATRLIHGWTHLEKQRGGIGLRGGPGETQLEIDRRLLRKRIKILQERLDNVHQQRKQIRHRRLQQDMKTVALIGYTHTGKSTLFNLLTQAKEYISHQLFSTLDPAVRQILLPGFGEMALTDTVGFIRDLPHDLIEAFKATLEETKDANLLLHIVDAHIETRIEDTETVQTVLHEIGAYQVPQLFVYNKIDLLEGVEPKIDRDENNKPIGVWISALQGKGIDLLLSAIAERLGGEIIQCCVKLPSSQMKRRAELCALKAIVHEQYADNGDFLLELKLPAFKLNNLLADLKKNEEHGGR